LVLLKSSYYTIVPDKRKKTNLNGNKNAQEARQSEEETKTLYRPDLN